MCVWKSVLIIKVSLLEKYGSKLNVENSVCMCIVGCEGKIIVLVDLKVTLCAGVIVVIVVCHFTIILQLFVVTYPPSSLMA